MLLNVFQIKDILCSYQIAMKSDIEQALDDLGIHRDEGEFHSLQSLQSSLRCMKKSRISGHTRHYILLLQHLPDTLLESSLSEEKQLQQILRESMDSVMYNEESSIISTKIKANIPSIYDCLFKMSVELFPGLEESDSEDNCLSLKYLIIPNDKSKRQYEGCKISLKGCKDSFCELKICGQFSILVLVFYFDKMIEIILRSAAELDSDRFPEDEKQYLGNSSIDYTGEGDSSNGSMTFSSAESVSNGCVDCSLAVAATKISDFTKDLFDMRLINCETHCLENADALGLFTDALCSLLDDNEFSKKSVNTVKSNMVSFMRYVGEKATFHRFRIYLRTMHSLETMSCDGKDKMITFLNSVAFLFIETSNDISGLPELKAAKKSLHRYVNETSNFLCLQAVIETVSYFLKNKIDIELLLPTSCLSVLEHSDQIIDDLDLLRRQRLLSDVTRCVIVEGLQEKNIEVFELAHEKFFNNDIPSGRDNFLYYSKPEKAFYHLVIFDSGDVYLEKINIEKIDIMEQDLKLRTEYWSFTLKEESSMMKIKDKVLSYKLSIEDLKSQGTSQDISTSGISRMSISPDSGDKDVSIDNDQLEILNLDVDDTEDFPSTPIHSSTDKSPQKETLMNVNASKSFRQSASIPGSVLSDNEDVESLSTESDDSKGNKAGWIDTKISAHFVINQEMVLDYWKPETRNFVRDRTGRDWPLKYDSPCAVVMKYVHVRSANSRKRNVSFARLTGFCTICDAKHNYVIKEDSFKEVHEGEKTSWLPFCNLNVDVSVEGRFESRNGKPDLRHPFHLPEKCKGLDLRGEERRLIAMKASSEGASSVYREGMAYIQKEQIESGNRTSIRSLPVIK